VSSSSPARACLQKTLVDYIKAGHTLDDFLDGFPTVHRIKAEAYLEMTLEAANLARSAR
jgi:uncharacterized protein (DUF433 family)